MPLYKEYETRKQIITVEDAEKRILELEDSVITLESDAEAEFFERITNLENRVETLGAAHAMM